MDALRNSKKISLLAVAILFLFTYFNMILNLQNYRRSRCRHRLQSYVMMKTTV
jgi:hypothetical protein